MTDERVPYEELCEILEVWSEQFGVVGEKRGFVNANAFAEAASDLIWRMVFGGEPPQKEAQDD